MERQVKPSMQLEGIKSQKVQVNGKSLKTAKLGEQELTQEIKGFLLKYKNKHKGIDGFSLHLRYMAVI